MREFEMNINLSTGFHLPLDTIQYVRLYVQSVSCARIHSWLNPDPAYTQHCVIRTII